MIMSWLVADSGAGGGQQGGLDGGDKGLKPKPKEKHDYRKGLKRQKCDYEYYSY